MFHSNPVQGSAGNTAPFPRKTVYLTLITVSNYIRTPTCENLIAHQDFSPIEACDEDAFTKFVQAHHYAEE